MTSPSTNSITAHVLQEIADAASHFDALNDFHRELVKRAASHRVKELSPPGESREAPECSCAEGYVGLNPRCAKHNPPSPVSSQGAPQDDWPITDEAFLSRQVDALIEAVCPPQPPSPDQGKGGRKFGACINCGLPVEEEQYRYYVENDGWRHFQCEDAMRRSAAPSPAPQTMPAPETVKGWVLVPREPTPDMLERGYVHSGSTALSVYQAMIAAAPIPPTPMEGAECKCHRDLCAAAFGHEHEGKCRYDGRDYHTADRAELVAERDRLNAECASLIVDKQELSAENKRIMEERDGHEVQLNQAWECLPEKFRHKGFSLYQELSKLVDRAEAAESALAAERHANRTRPDYDLRCQDCGRAHILDTSIPSEIWNVIASDVGILCMTCIDDRLVKHDIKCDQAEFYFVGAALSSKLYEESHGTVASLKGQLAAAGKLASAIRLWKATAGSNHPEVTRKIVEESYDDVCNALEEYEALDPSHIAQQTKQGGEGKWILGGYGSAG